MRSLKWETLRSLDFSTETRSFKVLLDGKILSAPPDLPRLDLVEESGWKHRTFFDFINKEDLPSTIALFEKVTRSGKPWSTSVGIQNRSFLLTIVPHFERAPQKELELVLTEMVEGHTLASSQSEVQIENEELRSILRFLPVGVVVLNNQLDVMFHNAQLGEISGNIVKAAEVTSLFDLIPGTAPVLEPICRKVIETAKPVIRREIFSSSPLGAKGTHFLMSCVPITDSQEHAFGVAVALVDISAQKRAEHKLLAYSNHLVQVAQKLKEAQTAAQHCAWILNSVLGGIKDAIIVVSSDSRLVANLAARNLLGMSGSPNPEEVQEERLDHFLRSEFSVIPFSRAERGEIVREHEIYLKGANQATGRHYSCEVTPLKTLGSSEPEGGVIVLKDISQRKMAEKRFTQMAEELRRSHEELEQFSYVASHDLTEPLRAITSYLGLLERHNKGSFDQQSEDFLQYALEGATRLRLLMDGLLTYARVQAKAAKFDEVDLNEVIEVVLHNLRVSIEETKAEIVAKPLPTVHGEGVQLVQLFQNIIGNAIKYRSSDVPRIEITCHSVEDKYQIDVKDNGIGFDMQYADVIFQVFRRLHHRQEYGGMGVGLAICKRIVERHGGEIWAASEPGKGSIFSFLLGKAPTSSSEEMGAV